MIATITHKNRSFKTNFSVPIDISIPIVAGLNSVKAWHVDPVKIDPVVSGSFIGDVNQGGSVNFKNITFNPHGHGTHTECVGHIGSENQSINQTLTTFMFIAQVISIEPKKVDNDLIISSKQIDSQLEHDIEALIIRTLPNDKSKLTINYSDTNPAFLSEDVMYLLKGRNISHLLIDTPSVDKEFDNGALSAHHIFWEYPAIKNNLRTITELIYVPDYVVDGIYLLNLQISSFENDAAPSKPVLYAII